MRYAGGVDVGSTQTKAVVIDEARRIVGRSLIMTGANVVTAAQEAFQAALDDGVVREADVGYVIGTGYGRYKVTFGNDQVTEISCHARGAAHLFPGTRTVLDMGGQDTKAIRVDGQRRRARLLHERQVRGRHRALPPGRVVRAGDPARRARRHRPAVHPPGQDLHHLHRVRRVGSAGLGGQGEEDRGHPDGRPPLHRRAVGGPADAGRRRGAGHLHRRRRPQRGDGGRPQRAARRPAPGGGGLALHGRARRGALRHGPDSSRARRPDAGAAS